MLHETVKSHRASDRSLAEGWQLIRALGIWSVQLKAELNLQQQLLDSMQQLEQKLETANLAGILSHMQIAPWHQQIGMTQCGLDELKRRTALQGMRSMGMAQLMGRNAAVSDHSCPYLFDNPLNLAQTKWLSRLALEDRLMVIRTAAQHLKLLPGSSAKQDHSGASAFAKQGHLSFACGGRADIAPAQSSQF